MKKGICTVEDCDIHGWEEQFDNNFYPNAVFEGNDVIQKIALQKELEDYHEKIKDFIRKKTSEARQEEREALKKKIEGMKKIEDGAVRKSGNWDLAIGYNEALSDLLNELK